MFHSRRVVRAYAHCSLLHTTQRILRSAGVTVGRPYDLSSSLSSTSVVPLQLHSILLQRRFLQLPAAPQRLATAQQHLISDKKVRQRLLKHLEQADRDKTNAPFAVSSLFQLCEADLKKRLAVDSSAPQEDESAEGEGDPEALAAGLLAFLQLEPCRAQFNLLQVGGRWKVTRRLPGEKGRGSTPTTTTKESPQPPPPPADLVPPTPVVAPPQQPSKKEKKQKRLEELKQTLSPLSIAPLVPTYFIPVEALLALMPGYTEEHLAHTFQRRIPSVEMFTIANASFIRVTGGRRELTMEFADEAEERHPEYKPRLDLLEPLLAPLKRVGPGKWLPLQQVIAEAPPEAVAYLRQLFPQHILHATVFFKQMAHRVAVVIEEPSSHPSRPGGYREEADKGRATPAALPTVMLSLKPQPITDLSYENTPCPRLVQHLYECLHLKEVDVVTLEQQIPPPLLEEAKTFFPDFKRFVLAHQGLLALVPPDLVCLAHEKDKIMKKKMTLEQQLQYAVDNNLGRKEQRIIQRKIMLHRDPESPLKESEALCAACVAYLPDKGFVELKKFVMEVLPAEVSWWLPPFAVHLFKKYPQMVTVFEWREANRVCLQKPTLELPAGTLRNTFSDHEILLQCAAILARQKSQTSSTSSILGRLPFAMREDCRKKKGGGLTKLLREYPMYFSVVFRDTITFDGRGAQVSLVSMPPEDANLLSAPCDLNSSSVQDDGAPPADNSDVTG